jgi:hypothetical protein
VEIILNSIILIYNCYICILLIKTNSMIYICYIFDKGGVEICVLAVRDDEHNRGDSVGGCQGGGTRAGSERKSHGNGTEHLGNRPLNSKVGDPGEMLGTLGPRHPCEFTGEFGKRCPAILL